MGSPVARQLPPQKGVSWSPVITSTGPVKELVGAKVAVVRSSPMVAACFVSSARGRRPV